MLMEPLFEDAWVAKAANEQSPDSWVGDLFNTSSTLKSHAHKYLCTIKQWYDQFPATSNKEQLRNRRESFLTEQHLGVVNELFWWECMKLFNWSASPVFSKKKSRPDFRVLLPTELFCEVTTLNISDADRNDLSRGLAVDLNEERAKTIVRLFRKIVDAKLAQLMYGASKERPTILVLFDYTFWSNFGVDFSELDEILLQRKMGLGICRLRYPRSSMQKKSFFQTDVLE